MFAQSRELPSMTGYVCELKARHGLKVAVVSNEGRELTEHRIRTFRLSEFVDFFVSSCFVHIRKPDTDIFRLALDIAQVPPTEVAYVEDRRMFVQVARQMGILGIHHTDFETTRSALARAGLTA